MERHAWLAPRLRHRLADLQIHRPEVDLSHPRETTHARCWCNLHVALEVVLSYMNNLACPCGMKPVFKCSYYVGTFSEYDLGVIPRPR